MNYEEKETPWDPEHLEVVRGGANEVHRWRKENPGIKLKLIEADLSHEDLSYADLEEADLSRADLRAANLVGTNLNAANLSAANLTHALLSETDFGSANLSSAKFDKHDLSQMRLGSANLSNVDFSETDFSKADLSCVNLRNSDLTLSNLSQADLSDAKLDHADFREANMENARLQGATLTGAKLDAAKLAGANLSSATVNDASFLHADLHNVSARRIKFNKGMSCMGVRAASVFGDTRFRRMLEDLSFIEETEELARNSRKRIDDWRKARGRRVWQIGDWDRCLKFDWWFARWPSIWKWSSDYGNSPWRLSTRFFQAAFWFAVIYLLPEAWGGSMLNWEGTFVDADCASPWLGMFYRVIGAIYFSVVTLTTLGFGDITAATWYGALVIVTEVILGYVILGLLIAMLANKVARRA